MPIVDAHQHLWDLERVAYPWLTADFGPLFRSFSESELEPQLAAAGVDKTVLVQAANSAADTDAMFEVADRWSRVAGVVGWVPLDRPDAAGEELTRLKGREKFVGVRHLNHDEPDPDWLIKPEVHESLELVAAAGLTFDVVAVLPRHLELVSTLAEQHPNLLLVIDHLAKPPIKDRGWQPWAELLERAAAYPNVSAKISGLNTAAALDSWSAEDLQPYVDHAVELFGPSRLMFGGDWPVAILAGDYAQVWAATNEVLADLSAAERDQILGGTAIEFYRLSV